MAKGGRPLAIDLFCGVGGMSLGFEQAGFRVLAAVDVDPIHVETYQKNFPDTVAHTADLRTLTGQRLRELASLEDGELDVLFGGPPCGGFSVMGKRCEDDIRNGLLAQFARLVDELQPKYAVLENVEGLLSSHGEKALTGFLSAVAGAGYCSVDPVYILDASSYGVPQRRRRVFIVVYRDGLRAPVPPLPKGMNGTRGPTVWDAIGDLACVKPGQTRYSSDWYFGSLGKPSTYAAILRGEQADKQDRSNRPVVRQQGICGFLRTRHDDETIERFSATRPGESEKVSRFHRLAKDGISPTLRAGTDRDHGSFMAPRPIHPTQPRCITVREGARLHSFPDWFHFHPTRWHGFRQVGNAVPPMLARAAAGSIADALLNRNRER